jgi:hypothetical protein
MNKQFEELAAKANFGHIGKPNTDIQYDPRLSKFAELIVQECLAIVQRKEYSYHEADPLWETAELIKEHFGVER